VQFNGARSFIITVGVHNHLERGIVLSKDHEDPDPTEHSTFNLCDSGNCRTTSDVSPALPCFSACVALQYAPCIAQSISVGYATDVGVDSEASRGHNFPVCYDESRTETYCRSLFNGPFVERNFTAVAYHGGKLSPTSVEDKAISMLSLDHSIVPLEYVGRGLGKAQAFRKEIKARTRVDIHTVLHHLELGTNCKIRWSWPQRGSRHGEATVILLQFRRPWAVMSVEDHKMVAGSRRRLPCIVMKARLCWLLSLARFSGRSNTRRVTRQTRSYQR
jgi:hypothetical protein